MTHQPDASGRWKRPDASMSLLADMTGDALDPGYAAAAARTGAAGRQRSRSNGRLALLAAVTAVGLLLATAAAKVRQDEPVAERQRERIIAEIQVRTAQTDRLQDELSRLHRETSRARAERLARSAAGRRADRELRRLALVTGATPVEGPGIRVTVDDTAAGDGSGASAGAPGTRVLDRDLQQLVNALWAAGASAVAVDDQRLTAVTAIRSAGDAVLVDYRPVSPPYVVTAIGDPRTLEVRFADSAAGRLFRTLESTFGIRYDIERNDRLRLPGAAALTLHYAREVPHQ